jgi:hypothetical protein
MTTGLDVFDKTVQESNLWLKDVMERARHQRPPSRLFHVARGAAWPARSHRP